MKGKRLPRAISFCAALYSIGLPPELLGLARVKPNEVKVILEHYPNFLDDMREATAYLDMQALSILPPQVAEDIRTTVKVLKIDPELNMIHQSLVRAIRNLLGKDDPRNLTELITQAARERKFLG